jgi:hypothetical protein
MNPLNKILGTLSVLGAFVALFGLLHAQDAATPAQLISATLNGTPTQVETTDVDVMLQAIEGTGLVGNLSSNHAYHATALFSPFQPHTTVSNPS